jgi:hypothetical protein
VSERIEGSLFVRERIAGGLYGLFDAAGNLQLCSVGSPHPITVDRADVGALVEYLIDRADLFGGDLGSMADTAELRAAAERLLVGGESTSRNFEAARLPSHPPGLANLIGAHTDRAPAEDWTQTHVIEILAGGVTATIPVMARPMAHPNVRDCVELVPYVPVGYGTSESEWRRIDGELFFRREGVARRGGAFREAFGELAVAMLHPTDDEGRRL